MPNIELTIDEMNLLLKILDKSSYGGDKKVIIEEEEDTDFEGEKAGCGGSYLSSIKDKFLKMFSETYLFTLEDNENYFYVNDEGGVDEIPYQKTDLDDWNIESGNCFKSIDEAVNYHEYLQCLRKVRNAIINANEGSLSVSPLKLRYQIVWSYDHTMSSVQSFTYCIFTKFTIVETMSPDKLSSIPFCKTSEIAQSIIDKYKQELDIISNYQN